MERSPFISLPAPRDLLQLQIVRYFLAALSAMVVDISVFWLMMNHVLEGGVYTLLGLSMPDRLVALSFSFSAGLAVNFTLSKLFVFGPSSLRTRTQFGRFATVMLFVLLCNGLAVEGLYSALDSLVASYPETMSVLIRASAAVSIGIVSFTLHRLWSFKPAPDDDELGSILEADAAVDEA